jgi:hypothetical protein
MCAPHRRVHTSKVYCITLHYARVLHVFTRPARVHGPSGQFLKTNAVRAYVVRTYVIRICDDYHRAHDNIPKTLSASLS